MSKEVVSSQLDGLLRGDEGQVHSGSCGAWGAGEHGEGSTGRSVTQAGEALGQHKPPAGRAPPQSLLGSPPALSPTLVPGGAGPGRGSASSGHSPHPPCAMDPFWPS